jgi:hypothetical protein
MTARKDMVDAVLRARDQLDPEFDTELLEAIVDAEADAPGDAEAALRQIDAGVTGAIDRGFGHIELAPATAGDGEEDDDTDLSAEDDA